MMPTMPATDAPSSRDQEAEPDPLLVLSFEPAHAILDRFVFGDLRGEAVDGLQAYFHHHIYATRRFERLDGGGDRAEVANVLTGTDLAALPLLSIRLTRDDMVLDVLETHAVQISALLATIPADVAMAAAPWSLYAEGSPAYELYWLLWSCRGVGRTTAYKLLARKRPHLLPVYDERLRRLLGRPRNSWACLWSWFQVQPERAAGLANLRDEAGDIDDISLLRVLDVALWMYTDRYGTAVRPTDRLAADPHQAAGRVRR